MVRKGRALARDSRHVGSGSCLNSALEKTKPYTNDTLTDLLLRGVEGLAHVLNLLVLGRDGRLELVDLGGERSDLISLLAELLILVLKLRLKNVLEQ